MTPRTRALAAVATLALGLGGAIVVATPASAASFTVTDPGDTNTPGTLRYALNHLDPGGPNTITIGAIGPIVAATLLPTISQSVSITGPGEAALTITSTLGTVFSIVGGAPNIDVAISALTIASPAAGACGISATHANLTITALTASNFLCSGVSVTDGSLTATDVTVENDATGIAFAGSTSAHFLSLTRIHANRAAFAGVHAVLSGGSATVSSVVADRAGVFGFFFSSTGAGSNSSISDVSTGASTGQGIHVAADDHATITATRLTSTGSASTGLWLSATAAATLAVQSSTVQGTLNNSGIWVDRVAGGSALTIAGSTISGNHSSDDGGGIDVDRFGGDGSTLVISDSTVSANTSVDFGGGIYLRQPGGGVTSTARVTIVRTTIDSNNGGGYGGGLAIDDPTAETSGLPTVLVDSSTLSNNVTPYGGGGIHIRRSTSGDPAIVKILNSTITGNDAQVSGGIDVSAASYGTHGGPGGPGGPGGGTPGPLLLTAIISHSTVANNSAHTSGGIGAGSGDQSLEIDTSIVSGGTSNNGSTPDDLDVGSPFTTRFSLIQKPRSGVVVPAGFGNLTGVDPLLAPLANNGGVTKTMLIAPGSPAYNAGDPAFTGAGLFDQRGQARVFQIVDMGAVEWQPALALTGGAPRPETPLIALLLLSIGLALVAASRIRRAA